ncbi:MAG: M15 family metallopeptidase [Clostridia bacterium]|nr:M15 family metallopeptidase [Clostridia bacterium]
MSKIRRKNLRDLRWQKYKPRYYRDESQFPEVLYIKPGYDKKNYISFVRKPKRPVFVLKDIEDENRAMKKLSILRRMIGISLAVVIIAFTLTFIGISYGPKIYDEYINKKPVLTEEEENTVINIGNAEPVSYDKETGLAIYGNEFNLMVISSSEPADESFKVDTIKIDGVPVDKRIADALSLMLSDAEAAGVEISLESGYITYEDQGAMFDSEVERLEKSGTTHLMSEYTAEQNVAKAGQSDAQTGMSVVVSNKDHVNFQNTSVYRWLNSNAASYGFIFRYPSGRSAFTGRTADYSVLRYVGRDNAMKMRQLSMCLEEYILYIYSR